MVQIHSCFALLKVYFVEGHEHHHRNEPSSPVAPIAMDVYFLTLSDGLDKLSNKLESDLIFSDIKVADWKPEVVDSFRILMFDDLVGHPIAN